MGWGFTLIFSYKVGSDHLFRFKILNFNIFFFFSEKWILFGYDEIVDIFGDHHETELFWGGGGGHLYTFQAFYRSMYRIGFFSLFFFFFWAGGGGRVVKSQIFFGAPDILDILRWTVNAGSKPTYQEKKNRVPPPHWGRAVLASQRGTHFPPWLWKPSCL